jgi:hypothetical protein
VPSESFVAVEVIEAPVVVDVGAKEESGEFGWALGKEDGDGDSGVVGGDGRSVIAEAAHSRLGSE